MLAIVCALRCEALPLIESYRLVSFPQKTLFPLYFNEEIFLIIAGVGKLAAASATTYLYSLLGELPSIGWLNIGIGGHPNREIGEMVLAHQVLDVASGATFYPSFLSKPLLPTDTLFTVDRPEVLYPQSGIYEMEGAGFFASALRFSSSELIHALKIVSDNPSSLPKKDPYQVQQLLLANLPAIEKVVSSLFHLAQEVKEMEALCPELEELTATWSFTQTQRHQLKRLLSLWRAKFPTKPIEKRYLVNQKRAKEVLAYLKQELGV